MWLRSAGQARGSAYRSLPACSRVPSANFDPQITQIFTLFYANGEHELRSLLAMKIFNRDFTDYTDFLFINLRNLRNPCCFFDGSQENIIGFNCNFHAYHQGAMGVC
jgi:hypothetical protein